MNKEPLVPKSPMDPLDPQLRRVVHDGMVQAVPGPEVEQRVLQGLLARLESGPAGPEPEPEPDPGPEGAPKPDVVGGPEVTAAGGSTVNLVAVVGAVALLAVAWVAGGRRSEAPAGAPAATRSPVEVGADPSDDSMPVVEPGVMPSAGNDSAPVAEPGPSSSPDGDSARVVEPAPPSEPAAPARSREAAPARRAPAPPNPPPTDTLDAEVRLLAAAEKALEAGDAKGALEHVREHARAFARGQLAVERRAIELGARCVLGEAEAVAAARTFLLRHGQVPAAATVRSRCEASP